MPPSAKNYKARIANYAECETHADVSKRTRDKTDGVLQCERSTVLARARCCNQRHSHNDNLKEVVSSAKTPSLE